LPHHNGPSDAQNNRRSQASYARPIETAPRWPYLRLVFQPRWATAEDADPRMPRYFFHINDEVETIRDEKGIELYGLDAVGKVATKSARW